MPKRGAPVERRPFNELLRRLNRDDYQLLAPHLERVDFPANEVLYTPGQDVRTVFFPVETSSASFVVSIEDGHEVQVLHVGYEGAVGGIISHGYTPAFSRIAVQFGGSFMQMPIHRLEQAKKQSRTLDHLFTRYADCLLAQCFQSIACNAVSHYRTTRREVARRSDPSSNDYAVPLTHEQFATMLGVGRSYVTRIISDLKEKKILQTARRSLVITDVAALERASCACNEAVENHFREVLLGLYSDGK